MTLVNNFAQFKAAILDLNEDTIVLTDNIQGLVSGVIIPPSKTNLIIDGKNPSTGEIHTFTDYNSAAFGDTIRLNSATGEVNITIRNLNIVCRNFYGIIGIINSSVTSNVNLNFENITMEGVQLSYNRFGHTTIKDSIINIKHLTGALSSANEFAETNRITFMGKVDIIHESTANSCIYFTNSNPSFIIEENAQVNISITARELIFASNPVNMEFKENSIFNLTTNHGMFYSTGNHRARDFIVRKNATIVIKQLSRNGTVPTIHLEGGMTLEADITLKIFVSYANAAPLIYLNTNNAALDFTNPKRIILYNASGNIFAWNNSGTININTHIVNYWASAQDGTIDDQPDYNYRKINNSNLTIVSQILNNNTSSTSTNYIQGEDGPDILNNTTFNTMTAHVITLGKLPLLVDDITDSSENVSGNTSIQSTVRYTNEAIEITNITDTEGKFDLKLTNVPLKNTKAVIISNNDYLNHRLILTIIGSLRFYEVPALMMFESKVVPTRKTTILREKKDWHLSVIDTRENGAPWQVYATIEHELSCVSEEIPNAVIYKNTSDQPLSTTGILIYEGLGNTEDSTITTIEWQEELGILLKLQAGVKYKGALYKTFIDWQLIST